jgi:hypothetical protein
VTVLFPTLVYLTEVQCERSAARSEGWVGDHPRQVRCPCSAIVAQADPKLFTGISGKLCAMSGQKPTGQARRISQASKASCKIAIDSFSMTRNDIFLLDNSGAPCIFYAQRWWGVSRIRCARRQ